MYYIKRSKSQTASKSVAISLESVSFPKFLLIFLLAFGVFNSNTSVAQGTQNNPIFGWIDNVANNGPQNIVQGWACAKGLSQSIFVHVYSGGPAGVGHFVMSSKADQNTEAGVNTACLTSGVKHRFKITLPNNISKGTPIFVHGIQPNGGSNLLIGNHGILSTAVPNNTPIAGYINKVTFIDGKFYVMGWACATGINQSIRVAIYKGGAYGTGTWVVEGNANLWQDSGLSNRCGTSGVAHQFSIPLPDGTPTGQAIYVYGIHPYHGIGGYNALLGNSGNLYNTVPNNTPVVGYINNLIYSGGKYHVMGWACAIGINKSIKVAIYRGGAYGTGTWATEGNANLWQDNGLSTRCGTSGVAHQFSIPLPAGTPGGQSIYIYGIHPYSGVGGYNALLGNSGTLTTIQSWNETIGSLDQRRSKVTPLFQNYYGSTYNSAPAHNCDTFIGFAYEYCHSHPWFANPQSTGYSPASTWNYGSSYSDQVIQSSNVRIRSSTALAGAIASLSYKGYDFINSGGHGAAFQGAVHFMDGANWWEGSECANPTEAGSMDDDSAPFPHHGPSSTAIIRPESGGWGFGSSIAHGTMWSSGNWANYVPPGKKSAFDGCTASKNMGLPTGTIVNKTMYLGGFFNGEWLENVLIFDYEVSPNRDANFMDLQIVAYLNGKFTQQLYYDANGDAQGNHYVQRRTKTAQEGGHISNGSVARIFADSNWGQAMGVMNGPIVRSGELNNHVFTLTEVDIPKKGYDFKYNNLTSQRVYSGVKAGEKYTFRAFFPIGSVEEVKVMLRKICKSQGQCR